MKYSGRHDMSAMWQTWVMLAGTVAVGRWLAGGGFGYTLFSVVWGPIAVGWVTLVRRTWPTVASGGGLVTLFALPWLAEWPTGVAVCLTAWLALFVGAEWSIRRSLMSFGTNAVVARGMTAILWLIVVIAPLTSTVDVRHFSGDKALVSWLKINPVLLMNAADGTAGDWTHQQAAYSYLTRLGQDIPFEWTSGVGGIVFYGLVFVIGAIVPRGTTQAVREKCIEARSS